ncbi:MAG: hypothetical protein K5873_01410 [Treponema sp.]|nr:hypothetical protein [Treponema sp.]
MFKKKDCRVKPGNDIRSYGNDIRSYDNDISSYDNDISSYCGEREITGLLEL